MAGTVYFDSFSRLLNRLCWARGTRHGSVGGIRPGP